MLFELFSRGTKLNKFQLSNLCLQSSSYSSYIAKNAIRAAHTGPQGRSRHKGTKLGGEIELI